MNHEGPSFGYSVHTIAITVYNVNMTPRRTFFPIGAFNSSAFGSTSVAYALASTARVWLHPGNRSVRLVGGDSSASFYAEFGTSDVEASTNSFLALPRQPYVVYVTPSHSHVAFVSSTSVTVNVAIGHGGENEEDYRRDGAAVSGPPPSVLGTIQEAGSIIGVPWLDEPATWSIGDAAHIYGGFHHSTST